MNRREKLINFLILNLVLALMPTADIFYLIPSRLTSGGLYGLALILTHAFGLAENASIIVPAIALVLTSPLLIYSYLYFDREYVSKTTYATLSLPVYMFIMGAMLNILGFKVVESHIALSTFLGSLIQGVAVGLAIGLGGSTGGVDIIGKIVNRYFPAITIGTGIMIANLAIAAITALVFGLDRAVASIVSILLTGWFIDITLWYGFKKTEGDEYD